MEASEIIEEVENLTNKYGDIEGSSSEKIVLAQELLQASLTLCREVVEEKDDKHAEAYIVNNLAVLVDNNHGFLNSSFNLQDWINQLEREGD